jgi:phospholipid/cholesterol/gamma-HCH transport system permease protein
VVRADRQGERVRLIPTGRFDLDHIAANVQAIANAETAIDGCSTVELDLGEVDRIDGTGAFVLMRFLNRLEEAGRSIHIVQERNPKAVRLIALYRQSQTAPPTAPRRGGRLARLGSATAELPGVLGRGLDFTGHVTMAVPESATAPRSVDWRSVPRLIQTIGADGLPVAAAANLLIGLIVGSLGVQQLARFGAEIYVPELVVVTQFRELGPLVTALLVAGRSGAGIASEIATMKVSEEIDALRSMGFDPIRWLVVPRCVALVISVPILTWIGDVLSLAGGLISTTVISDVTPHAYVVATANVVTPNDFLSGLAKSPFLGLAIGLIACAQGLATHGGAAAVGARTTTAVVMATFAVIVISALFTLLYAVIGV